MRRKVLVTGCMLSLLMVAPVLNVEAVDNVLGVETAYASDGTRSVYGGCVWENTGGTSWKAKQADGSYLCNAWYQDTDGSWYLMKSDGYMAEQIFTDTDGSVYLLDWRHDGTYGKLLISGTYNGVYIQTNENHDGTWGRILNTDVIPQLQEAINGVTHGSSGGSNSVNTGNQGSNTGGNGASFWDEAAAAGKNQLGDKPLPIDGELMENIKNATFY